jgi:hypothetical protein
MPYNRDAQRILTVIEALQRRTIEELKKLAALVSDRSFSLVT